jgi:hypothetical protein
MVTNVAVENEVQMSDYRVLKVISRSKVTKAEFESWPRDVQINVLNRVMTPDFARRLVRVRKVEETLWTLARQAGIEEQLLAQLAG